MSKQEFLGALYNGLSGLPKEDIENSVQFYSEMIDDRMESCYEDGCTRGAR